MVRVVYIVIIVLVQNVMLQMQPIGAIVSLGSKKTVCKSQNALLQAMNTTKKLDTSFSKVYTKMFFKGVGDGQKKEYIWEELCTHTFDELIMSWNAHRPKKGNLTFFISVLVDKKWTKFGKIAEWSSNGQRTFFNRNDRYVHIKHVRAEMQNKSKASGFRIKVISNDSGTNNNLRGLKALFVNTIDMRKCPVLVKHYSKSSCFINRVPQLSQMELKHRRAHDLCAATSLSIVMNFFAYKDHRHVQLTKQKLEKDAVLLASQGYDQNLDIYGNWLLNTAAVYDHNKSTQDSICYFVRRLNGIDELYRLIQGGTPVIVSVRKMKNGATPYEHGHFVVVIGWNKAKQSIICIDPAFKPHAKTLKVYKVGNFVQAWRRSRYLAYVPRFFKHSKQNFLEKPI